MNQDKPQQPLRKSNILTYLFILLILGCLGIMFNILFIHKPDRENYVGDGVNVSSYKFDLSNCLVDQTYIAASGIFKDGHEIIDYPELMHTLEMDAMNEEIRGKYQVSADRVIGVSLNGEVKAYPIRIMQWHEVINDTVGNVPIAVTYSPLSDSVVVFDRRVGGETLEFGLSGLLYNSTMLLYDRRENDAEESLWSQLQFRAISGIAAAQGKTLTTLPCILTRWDEWKERYPNSMVVKPNVKKMRQYQSDPFGPYHSMDNLDFDVSPKPPLDPYLNKTHMIVLRMNQNIYPIAFPVIKENAKQDTDGDLIWDAVIGDQSVQFKYTPQPETVQVMNDPSTLLDDFSVVYAYHFAWFSHHPDVAYLYK